jgi:transcriptional regulator with XRE-family HTH domain
MREIRLSQNLTLEEASKRTGLARSTLSKIENEQISPTFTAVNKLVKGLGIDIPQLFSQPRKTRRSGGRRDITRCGEGKPHPTPTYEHEMLAPQLSNKKMIPYKTTVRARSFDLPRSLATLAWEGRRRDLFEGELIATMKMVDRGVPRSRLVGSWAGAFGNPQFLPSVYLRLARDGDGDGQADIWNSEADTLASIAAYFRDAGWRPGQPWGVRAFVPNSVDRAAVESRLVAPVCPRVHVRHSKWMSVSEWRARGVIPQRFIPDDAIAALFEPDGPAAPGYLLTQNYRVILEYNCSNYYAMSVGLLADEIAR